MNVIQAPKRAIKTGRAVWVKLTETEFEMLGLEYEPISKNHDEQETYMIIGHVIIAEPDYKVRVAVGYHVLHLPWERIYVR